VRRARKNQNARTPQPLSSIVAGSGTAEGVPLPVKVPAEFTPGVVLNEKRHAAERGRACGSAEKTARTNGKREHRTTGKKRVAVERLQKAAPYDFAVSGTAFFARFGGGHPAYVRAKRTLQQDVAKRLRRNFKKSSITVASA
jgi:hypothetical protein